LKVSAMAMAMEMGSATSTKTIGAESSHAFALLNND
jgi:hypothetical protein